MIMNTIIKSLLMVVCLPFVFQISFSQYLNWVPDNDPQDNPDLYTLMDSPNSRLLDIKDRPSLRELQKIVKYGGDRKGMTHIASNPIGSKILDRLFEDAKDFEYQYAPNDFSRMDQLGSAVYQFIDNRMTVKQMVEDDEYPGSGLTDGSTYDEARDVMLDAVYDAYPNIPTDVKEEFKRCDKNGDMKLDVIEVQLCNVIFTTLSPTNAPSASPTNAPSHSPSNAPTNAPSDSPSNAPTNAPSDSPSNAPTNSPI